MYKVYAGTISHYNAEKQLGFITPDVRREDGKDIFFHRNNGCQITEENSPGELELDTGSTLAGEPQKGMRVVYRVSDMDVRGPGAFAWTWETYWNICLEIISWRPAPDDPWTRIVESHPARAYRQQVLWEGWHSSLVEYLDTVTPDLSSDTIWLEEKWVNGWHRVWHPSEWHPKYKKEKATV